MLTSTSRNAAAFAGKGLHIAIVCSRYNTRYTDGLLRGARKVLKSAGTARVTLIRVPGAFEIPIAAAMAAKRSPPPHAVICLGVIWQGETTHADHIGKAVTDALMRLSLDSGVPCIHEVITVRTEEQARARCLNPETN